MARKMGLRGRPGLLFLFLVIIFIIVFVLTWRSMRTSEKSEVKDIYSSVQLDALSRNTRKELAKLAHNSFQSREKELSKQDKADMKKLQDQLRKDHLEVSKINRKGGSLDQTSQVKNNESPLSALLHPENAQNTKPSTKDVPNCKPTVEGPAYYHEPDPSIRNVLETMQRLVHLDLKGAAPKTSYYQTLFPLLTQLGATGLLIEYEDMFPYTGDLKNISALNSYTPKDIEEILALARKNSLSVIPIIQTFGHMEFVLKSMHFKEMRESEHTPQVINVVSSKSYELIGNMVRQILAAHPLVTSLHIGCDEVYEIGRGKSADILISEKIGKEHLFVRHVKRVAEIVAQESKGKVKPIIWDDELRSINESIILESGIPSLVDIMVWKYTPNISISLDERLWEKYSRLFKSVWTASSFKGATGPQQFYTEAQYHIQNHFSWIKTISKYKNTLHFKGIALTGWSRFDHFATLCELLPVAIPSLAVCLATLKHGGFNKDIHLATSRYLSCTDLIEMSFPKYDLKLRKAKVTQDCRFPGSHLYYGMQQYWGCRQQGQESKEAGWMSQYQVSHGFSNPGQLKVMAMRLAEQASNYIKISTPLKTEMSKIYSEDTVEEWMDENINEQRYHIKETQEKIKGLLSSIHWERRPLQIVLKFPSGSMVSSDHQAMKSHQVGVDNNNSNTKNKAFSGKLDIHSDGKVVLLKQTLPLAQGQVGNRLQPSLGFKGNPIPGQNGVAQSNAGLAISSSKVGNSLHPSDLSARNMNKIQLSPRYNVNSDKSAIQVQQPDLSNSQRLGTLYNDRKMANLPKALDAQKNPSDSRNSDLSRMNVLKGHDVPRDYGKSLSNAARSVGSSVLDSKINSALNHRGKDKHSTSQNSINDGTDMRMKSNNGQSVESKEVNQDHDWPKFHQPSIREMNNMNILTEHSENEVHGPGTKNGFKKPIELEEFKKGKEPLGKGKDAIEGIMDGHPLDEQGLKQESDIYRLQQEENSGLNAKFVEALRKSHNFNTNQESIDKALFPDLTHDSKEETM